ncbi:MAG: lysine-2,3-aminomutase-like protein [Hyphomicrobiaceae bacterium]
MSSKDRTVRSVEALITSGLVAPELAAGLHPVADRYAIAISPAMQRLIADGAPAGIARQFVPDARELTTLAEERADPIGDGIHEKLPGLVHRYPDRVLLKVTHACPVYCRFCFRREMVGPGGPQPMVGAPFDAAIDYISADTGIFEVILTGGDPLMLAPRRIGEITARLLAIPHVKLLRWHTRVPVVTPERITDELTHALRPDMTDGKAIYIGIHTNHPAELTGAARDAITRLQRQGLHLVSQTVLLAGINNDPDTLATLFRELVTLGIRPYYLHHPDLAPGTGHFRVSIAEGQAIMRALRGRISGLALPTYVLDIPGGHGKVTVGPGYISTDGSTVTDVAGRRHVYPPEPEAL